MFRISHVLLAFVLALAVPGLANAQPCTSKLPPGHLVEPAKLQVSVNPTSPPQQYVDDKGELQGLNIELGREIAKRLCLEPVFIRMDFPAMTPALRASRFDAIFSGMFWTEERSKLFYMVPVAKSAISVFGLPDSPLKVTSFDDLAGHIVGLEAATYQETKAHELNTDMVKRGLKPIDFRAFSTATETLAALRAKQLEAAVNLDEVARSLERRGLVTIWLHGLAATDNAYAFRDKDVANAVAGVLDELKADGFYGKVFDKFGMTPQDVAKFGIRGTGPS
jgi:polar amino acid transport system substrate-binding protein